MSQYLAKKKVRHSIRTERIVSLPILLVNP